MSRINYILVIYIFLSLSACAGNEKKPPQIKDEFITHIEQSGQKLFSYTVTMATLESNSNGRRRGGGMSGGSVRGGMGGTGMNGGGMRRGSRGMNNEAKLNREAMMNRTKGVVYEKLKMKLSETGYCREGYTELDNYFIRGRSQIRGKCKESATEEDYASFNSKSVTGQ